MKENQKMETQKEDYYILPETGWGASWFMHILRPLMKLLTGIYFDSHLRKQHSGL